MNVTSINRFSPFSQPQRGGGGPEKAPEEGCDRSVLTGQIVGGLTAGAGLGYLGLNAGLEFGIESGMRAMGSHPAAQLLGILTVGMARGIVCGALGGALGAGVGIGAGAWLGGKVGEKF